MKSVCIKTNKKNNILYLLKILDCNKKENIIFSENEFKNYKNIIVHYQGKSSTNFISTISQILSMLVIEEYELNIIKRLINSYYFYFNLTEKETILQISLDLLSESRLKERLELLHSSFSKYLNANKSIVLEGFINFRLSEYTSYITSIIDTAVNKYIIEREYLEFISLLKIYVNSESSSMECVHLIYNNSQVILLNQDKKIIKSDTHLFQAKYLSDISFSSNDYALNTLLNIVPKTIYVHLSKEPIDEFINTLQLVFENRIIICNNCSLCNLQDYKSLK